MVMGLKLSYLGSPTCKCHQEAVAHLLNCRYLNPVADFLSLKYSTPNYNRFPSVVNASS